MEVFAHVCHGRGMVGRDWAVGMEREEGGGGIDIRREKQWREE